MPDPLEHLPRGEREELASLTAELDDLSDLLEGLPSMSRHEMLLMKVDSPEPYLSFYDEKEIEEMGDEDMRGGLEEAIGRTQDEVQERAQELEDMAKRLAEDEQTKAALDDVQSTVESALLDEFGEQVEFSGYETGSRYAQLVIEPDDEDEDLIELTMRISDHKQPTSGGFSEERQERYGIVDVDIVVDVDSGEARVWSQYPSHSELDPATEALAGILADELDAPREAVFEARGDVWRKM